MPVDQEIEKIKGKQIWVETVSYVNVFWALPFSFTTVAGEVKLHKKPPPKRKEPSIAEKVFCVIFWIFCAIGGAIADAIEQSELWKPKGEDVRIELDCTWLDRLGTPVQQDNKTCLRKNHCRCRRGATGFFYVKYPRIGANLDTVTGVRTEAHVSIDLDSVHHTTEANAY